MTAHLPASTLFGKKELKVYRRWQSLQPGIPECRYNTLPTAFEYEEYLEWRKKSRNGYFNNVFGVNLEPLDKENGEEENEKRWMDMGYRLATKCKHPLHPTHPGAFAEDIGHEEVIEDVEHESRRCPVCVIRAHLRFLAVLYDKWEDVGGPWRNWDVQLDPTGTKYPLSLKSFHTAKVDMINTLLEFEEWVGTEEDWEAENHDVEVEDAKEFGARKAIEMFLKENKYPTTEFGDDSGELTIDIAGLRQEHEEESVSSGMGTRKKVDFSPATLDTKTRSTAFYSRVCHAYDPGSKNACPEPEGWDDTSFFRDHLYSISQCRILLVIRDLNICQLRYRDLNPLRENNVHVEHLQNLVTEWLENLNSEESAYWKQYMSESSDIFLVYNNDWTDSDDFDGFEMKPDLKDTGLEWFARLIGDWDNDLDGELVIRVPASDDGNDSVVDCLISDAILDDLDDASGNARNDVGVIGEHLTRTTAN
ncbi:hypothetical protein CC78DRAFT_590285 [Lojkania enalia]|uniref:Uncharacterized protein n=1 Tax=Lojkania enalia TaxID=147567 RepID=A0A9P4N941_9PLEO|nr:hypothetical protein CC78DRAFT_590285 [Didymosphaeria enalia]